MAIDITRQQVHRAIYLCLYTRRHWRARKVHLARSVRGLLLIYARSLSLANVEPWRALHTVDCRIPGSLRQSINHFLFEQVRSPIIASFGRSAWTLLRRAPSWSLARGIRGGSTVPVRRGVTRDLRARVPSARPQCHAYGRSSKLTVWCTLIRHARNVAIRPAPTRRPPRQTSPARCQTSSAP